MQTNKIEETRLTDDWTRELEVDELEKSRGVSRRLYEASFVDGRVGHCNVGRRAALDWRKGGAEGGTLYRGGRDCSLRGLTGRLTGEVR